MVNTCANPDCGEPFIYLRDGNIYGLKVRSAAGGIRELFWLCGECSKSMALIIVAGAQPKATSRSAKGCRRTPIRAIGPDQVMLILKTELS